MKRHTGRIGFRRFMLLSAAVWMALLTPMSGKADAMYDRQAAVDYAVAHCGHGEKDACTIFVIKCLAAGGIQATGNFVVDLHANMLQYGTEYQAVLRNNNMYLYNQDNENRFEPGDVVFFYCETCAAAPWAHTGIITRIDDSGMVYFAQNNPSVPPTQFWNYHHTGIVGYNHYGSSVWILHIEPPALPGGAKEAWEDACRIYGRVPLVNYGGEVYLDEGNGAALPLLCRADGNDFLVVLVQQDEMLSQVVYRIDGNGTYRQVLDEQILALGDRASLFLYAESGSALVTAASLEDDLAVFAAASRTVKKTLLQGDETAESIADMGAGPWEAFRSMYGSPEWTVRVDANYGLFHLQFSGAEQALGIFDITIP